MVDPIEVRFEGDARDAERAFDQVGRAADRTEDKSKKLRETLRDLTVIGFGLVRAFKSVTSALDNTLDATDRQLRAEIGLGVALAKNVENVQEALDGLKGFASELQQATTFGDEFILELATIGAEFGLQVDKIDDAVEASLDRATALGRGPLEIMRVLSRFGAGVSDSLIDVGVVVDKTKDRTESFNIALEEMRTGMSRAIGELPTSSFTQLANNLGDLREKLGEVIASTATFQTIIGEVNRFVLRLNQALADPTAFREFVQGIDDFVQGTLQGLALIGAAVLRTVGEVLRLIEKMADTLGHILAELEDQSIPALEARVESLSEKLGRLNAAQAEAGGGSKLLAAAIDETEGALSSAQDRLDRYRGSTKLFSEEIIDASDALLEWSRKADIFSFSAKLASEVSAKLFEVFGMGADAQKQNAELTADQRKELEAFLAFQDEILTQLEALGGDFTSAFTVAIRDSFDSDTGIEEAFQNLGTNVRDIFIAQFSEAAFAPVKNLFGQLAVALAQPFQVVGNLLNRILAPVTNLISEVIGVLVTKFFTLIGLQELLAGTGLAAMSAVAAGAAPLASVWGAAAVAAAIATLGSATGFAAPAIAAITAGKALATAFSIPGAAEGAIAFPTPGGTLVRVAEAGRAEAIVPLDEQGGGAFGSTIVMSFEGADLHFRDEEQAAETIEALGGEFARQMSDAFGGNIADALLGGVT